MYYIITFCLGGLFGFLAFAIIASGSRAEGMQREMRYRELLEKVLKWHREYINPNNDWMCLLANFPKDEIEETLQKKSHYINFKADRNTNVK